MWGFVSGAASGCVVGVLAAFAGGPLGSGRLTAVGPSGWQVTLIAILEMGVTAAVAAGAANWLMLRHTSAGLRFLRPGPGSPSPIAPAAEDDADEYHGPAVVDETDDAGGHRIYLDPWAQDRGES